MTKSFDRKNIMISPRVKNLCHPGMAYSATGTKNLVPFEM